MWHRIKLVGQVGTHHVANPISRTPWWRFGRLRNGAESCVRLLIKKMVGSPNYIEVHFRANDIEMLAAELRPKAKLKNLEEILA